MTRRALVRSVIQAEQQLRTNLSTRAVSSSSTSRGLRSPMQQLLHPTNHSASSYEQQHQQQQQQQQSRQSSRSFSWNGHGTDLLSESLAHPALGTSGMPKIILNGHSRTGFDVANLIKCYDEDDVDLQRSGGVVHLCGSIIALPTTCFLWNIRNAQDITLESLSMIQLHIPALDYLFIGTNKPMDPLRLQQIKAAFKMLGEDGTVVEQMDVTNAMGTFNILNGEDRLVAAVMILEPVDDED